MSDALQLTVSLRQAAPIPLDIGFTCHPGDITTIFGPSGSGKTTVLRCIAGLHRPREGRITCGNEVWTDSGAGYHRPAYQRRVGFVFQNYALFPHLTALGNVMAALRDRARADRHAEASRLLEMVHLGALADRRPARLSGGECQRLALARALARGPQALLLDEPFAAVDKALRHRLQDELHALRHRLQVPTVLVTHDFDDVVRLATHVVILDRGRMTAAGPIESLTSRPDQLWLREAVGLGSVFDATAVSVDRTRGLTQLAFEGGTLLAPDHTLPLGARLRVRILAREVILALQRPAGLSVHNVLEGRVAAVEPVPHTDRVVVQLVVGSVRLLAEVTRDAVSRLALAPGVMTHALVKSVSIELASLPPVAPGPSRE